MRNFARKGFCLLAALLVLVACVGKGTAAEVRFHVTPGAEVRAFTKTTKHYTDFTRFSLKKASELDGNGYEVWTGNLPAYFHYLVGGRVNGKATGFLKEAQIIDVKGDTADITIDAKKLDRGYKEDNEFMQADLYLNVNDAQHLVMKPGDEFKLLPLRVWQAMWSNWLNYFFEPDHYAAPEGDDGVIKVAYAGKPGMEYFTIKALKPGLNVVKVTYEPIAVYGSGNYGNANSGKAAASVSGAYTKNDNDKVSYFNAIDPANTGVVLVNVIDGGSAANTDEIKPNIILRGNTPLRECDTIYFDRDVTDHAEYSFKPTNKSGPSNLSVRVHRPIHDGSGFEWGEGWEDGRRNADDSFTVDLYHGRNIVEISSSASDYKEYYVITAKGIRLNMSSKSNPDWKRGDPTTPGQQIEISFTGIKTPVEKLSAIYNPGFGNFAVVAYSFASGGMVVTSVGTQYDLSREIRNAIAVTAGEDGLLLTGGYLETNVLGSGWGAHRNIEIGGKGMDPNMSANGASFTFCRMPDIVMPCPSAWLNAVAGKDVSLGSSGGAKDSPKEGGVTVLFSKSSISADDITAAPGATVALYTDGDFDEEITVPIGLSDSEATHLYIAVTAQTGENAIYYDISVNRAGEASDNASLETVAGQTVSASGNGDAKTSPAVASVTVNNETAAVTAASITTAPGAEAVLYSDADFSADADSINLTVGTVVHAYVKVTAEDGTTVKYYDISVTRAAPKNSGASLSAAAGTNVTPTGGGTKENPKKASVTVESAKSMVEADDFKVSQGAMALLFTDANFASAEAAQSISLTAGGVTHAYVMVIAENELNIQYYDIAITREAETQEVPEVPESTEVPKTPETTEVPEMPEAGDNLGGVTIITSPIKPFTDRVEVGVNTRKVIAGEQSGLPSGWAKFTEVKDGVVVASVKAVEEGLAGQKASAADLDQPLVPLPVIETNVSSRNNTGLLSISRKLDEFKGNLAGDVVVLKLKRDGETVPLSQASSLGGIKDGEYILTDEDGYEIRPTRTIVSGVAYCVHIAVKDNGDYDWDMTGSKITDPAALAVRGYGSSSPNDDGVSSGNGEFGGSDGCSTGAFALVLALVPFTALVCKRRDVYRKE